MGSPEVVYKVYNAVGEYVCSRATMAECRRLLEGNVTIPPRAYWDKGPYSVRKVTTEHKFTFRPRQQPNPVPTKEAKT